MVITDEYSTSHVLYSHFASSTVLTGQSVSHNHSHIHIVNPIIPHIQLLRVHMDAVCAFACYPEAKLDNTSFLDWLYYAKT